MHERSRSCRGLAYAFLFALLPAAAFASSLEDALDRTSDPCQDFYQFACGGWLKAHPLPGDLPRYGRFDELQERNQETLRAILETAAAGGASRNAVDQKIGDYYAACMDEPAIEKLGLRPVKPTLDRIAALRDRKALPTLLAELHRQGVDAFFSFSSEQDFKEPTAVIAIADQGGIALPERDYYASPLEALRVLHGRRPR
jgi:putative endopeptidase